MKPKILVLCDFYLPGFKSGGGMWTVVNLIERFHNKYDFFVVCRNYDGREDRTPYTEVVTGDWNRVGNAEVFYVSDSMLGLRSISNIIRETKPDLIFLNSFFATPSVIIFLLRLVGKHRDIPVLLAPCGNLSEKAIGLKPLKKRFFLFISRIFRLQKGMIWKATSEIEKKEITQALGGDQNILIASDLPPDSILPDLSLDAKPKKESGSVKLIFLSRVVRKKNLDFLLRSLLKVEGYPVSLNIVGPLEDKEYWDVCRSVIKRLPKNISINVTGGVTYEEALHHLIDAHFMVLPTLNENFGYVFIEAMAAGCPLIISKDTTIWNDLDSNGLGWDLPIDSTDIWAQQIISCAKMDAKEYLSLSQNVREYASNWLANPDLEAATETALEKALGS